MANGRLRDRLDEGVMTMSVIRVQRSIDGDDIYGTSISTSGDDVEMDSYLQV